MINLRQKTGSAASGAEFYIRQTTFWRPKEKIFRLGQPRDRLPRCGILVKGFVEEFKLASKVAGGPRQACRMSDRVRPEPAKHKTTNWLRHNQTLKTRGALMIWLDRDLQCSGLVNGKRGRPSLFSDVAIQFCLTITKAGHKAIALRQAQAIIPARKNARKPRKENRPGARVRNEILRTRQRLGRDIRKRWSGYHRRSLVETDMRCIKLMGELVMTRDFDRQAAELACPPLALQRTGLRSRFSQWLLHETPVARHWSGCLMGPGIDAADATSWNRDR